MVALYGATAAVHDHITRTPGSFEAVMQGFAYLKEAGVGFIVQIIPMKDNYGQLKDMIRLAESLSSSLANRGFLALPVGLWGPRKKQGDREAET